MISSSPSIKQVHIALKLWPSPRKVLDLLTKQNKARADGRRQLSKSMSTSEDKAEREVKKPKPRDNPQALANHLRNQSRHSFRQSNKSESHRDTGRSSSALTGSLKKRVQLLSKERMFIKYDSFMKGRQPSRLLSV
mmetsp:Transcript_10831/g.21169  ORF Transcript_10831/g.21169 Transcript_10831/m.21169 type:complete len:136 (+) Transcript_10831:2863-3270(+)